MNRTEKKRLKPTGNQNATRTHHKNCTSWEIGNTALTRNTQAIEGTLDMDIPTQLTLDYIC